MIRAPSRLAVTCLCHRRFRRRRCPGRRSALLSAPLPQSPLPPWTQSRQEHHDRGLAFSALLWAPEPPGRSPGLHYQNRCCPEVRRHGPYLPCRQVPPLEPSLPGAPSLPGVPEYPEFQADRSAVLTGSAGSTVHAVTAAGAVGASRTLGTDCTGRTDSTGRALCASLSGRTGRTGLSGIGSAHRSSCPRHRCRGARTG